MISVIVPVYNVEKYIERCLECLIRQTEKDIERQLVRLRNYICLNTL